MITNLIILVIIGLMATWFSGQGLFSSILHLFLTIIAGTLAFAVWEPLTIKLLLGFLPEYAWAIGLLLPFAISLFLLRYFFDKYVPGNLNFHNLVDSIGGAVVGVINGLLTAGILVIGLQFVANFDLFGYHPYQLTPTGQFERAGHLWFPGDAMAARLFTSLSSGSMSSGNSIHQMHGDLFQAASAFQAITRPYARYAIKPPAINITRTFTIESNAQLPAEIQPRTVVVSTTIQVSGSPDSAGDTDGTFTATKAQVALLATDTNGSTHVHHPAGFVANQAYAPLTGGQFTRSDSSVASENIDWLFTIPADQTPTYLRVKNLRLELPQTAATAPQVAEYVSSITWRQAPTPPAQPPVGEQPTQPPTTPDAPPPADQQSQTQPPAQPSTVSQVRSGGAGARSEGMEIIVTDRLPMVLSKNWLATSGANIQSDALVSGDATVQVNASERIMANLAVNRIDHPDTAQIVQVKMQEFRARSMLGQAYQFAAQTQAPALNSTTGDSYAAIGYSIHNSGLMEIHLNPDNPIRAMSQIDTSRMKPDDQLTLYFRVGNGAQLNQFNIGNASKQDITPPLPVP